MCLGIRSAHNGIQISLAQELSREYPVVWVSNPEVYHEVVIQNMYHGSNPIMYHKWWPNCSMFRWVLSYSSAGRDRTIGYLTHNGVLQLLYSSESVTGVSQ